MKKTPTSILRSKFRQLDPFTSNSSENLPLPDLTVTSPSMTNRRYNRSQLTSYLESMGLDPVQYKVARLGSGSRVKYMAAVTVEGKQYKTYPQTYREQDEAEEAVAGIVLRKLEVISQEVTDDGSTGVKTTGQDVDITSQYNIPPPLTLPTVSQNKPKPVSTPTPDTQYSVKIPAVSVTEKQTGSHHNKPKYNTAPYVTNTDEASNLTPRRNISEIPRDKLSAGSMEDLPTMPAVSGLEILLPSVSVSQSQRHPMESIDTNPSSPPPSVCSVASLRCRRMKAEDLFQASLAADNDQWLQFQMEDSIPAKTQLLQLEDWLRKHPPSKIVRSSGVGWIAVKLRDKGRKMVEAKVAWEELEGERNMEAVNQLAEQFGVKGGKWMCHLDRHSIDGVWNKVAKTLLSGGLGSPVYMVKVSPVDDVTQEKTLDHVLIVYNTDYTNTDQVMRVENLLRSAGVLTPLTYKPDIFSALGIYRNNIWGFRPTIYKSRCLVREGRSKIEVVGTGDWYYNSSNGLQYPATAHGVRTVQQGKIGIIHSKEMVDRAKVENIVVDKAKLDKIVVDRAKVLQKEEQIMKPRPVLVSDVGRIPETGENKKTGEMETLVIERTEVQDVYGLSRNVITQEKSEMEDDIISPVKVDKTMDEQDVYKSKPKKSLPAWMEKMEKQLGMMNIQDLVNL